MPYIEKVKSPKYAKYLEYLESPFMYEVEYKWTKKDTRDTTKIIRIAASFIHIPNGTLKSYISIHLI
tara:strand:+ start:728 stop:928 length:201 start_codon:yes stop_codon:yes gene_type:complete